MSSFAFVAFCAQIFLIQFASGQVINRSCGCSSSLAVPESYFPGTVLTGPGLTQVLPGSVLTNPAILPNGVIQSQSVANDLANTLQLLTVSSLLANKLPLNGLPVVGGCGLPVPGFPIGGLPVGGFPIGGFPVGGLPIGGCGNTIGYW